MTQPFTKDVRLHGKSPRLDHVRNSHSMLLCDAILDRIKLIPLFSGFNFKKTVAKQLQPEHVPVVGVYFVQEFMTPDGDPNAGEVRFRTSVRVGISVVIQNNDDEEANYFLDRAGTVIADRIFTDHTLYDGPLVKVQAFSNATRMNVFGSSPAKDNETPWGECRFEITCDLGTITYEPQITDNFETIGETTYPPGYDADTTPIVTIYDVDHEGR